MTKETIPVVAPKWRAAQVVAEGSPPALTSPALAALPGMRHGFFGRAGGVSTGVYASLNARLGSHDDPAAVSENLDRIAGRFDLSRERMIRLHQVHSARAVVAEAPWDGPWPGGRPEADAVATAIPNLALAVSTADCAPVLLADPTAGVIAAAHAGWRGAIGGVIEAALDAMETLGAEPDRVVAAVGPCISQAAYEVGPDLKAQFLAESPANAPLFRDGAGDRAHFDLAGYVTRRLARAGVGRVDVLPACTFSDPDAWFSHRGALKRGEGDYGCNLSVIVVTSAP
jgi:YfiH family protein